MPLLDTTTIRLSEFIKRPEKYEILSHWREEKEEVSLQDLPKRSCSRRKGYQKLFKCCGVARDQNIEYIWIDICCIDKTSNAELSEAINSMYDWYKYAFVCYVYLADVLRNIPYQIKKSEWFKRGWTLQELLAPSSDRILQPGLETTRPSC